MRQQLKLMVAMLAILGAYLVVGHFDGDPTEGARALAQELQCIPEDSSPSAQSDASLRARIARAVRAHREVAELEGQPPLCEPSAPEGAGDVRDVR